MATWRKYFNSSSNSGLPVNVTGAPTDGYATTHSRYSSWLPEVYAGSPNRLMRYIQYDQMDNDLEVMWVLLHFVRLMMVDRHTQMHCQVKFNCGLILK